MSVTWLTERADMSAGGAQSKVGPTPGALTTDLYELTMAASYLRHRMTGLATFSLFLRRLPAGRGFVVATGLDDGLRFLEEFHFEPDELDYLSGLGFDDQVIDRFRRLRFTGSVRAVPEGRVVFANEPILEVTAPIAEAQLVETYLLNQITFQSAIATKAARCRIAAGGADLIDFSFRRTHGVEAALKAARASAIAGFTATSNTAAARRYGLRATGTMAHSYVQAFGSESEAFAAFAADFPGRVTFLVDTYDTLSGVAHAIEVIRQHGIGGQLAIRLDSGDLLALSIASRRLLDAAGLARVRIVASGNLDEYEIERLVQRSAPIDAYGVGTRMGVSADAPYLDSVYKLVAFDGRPVMKLSPGKATHPGAKQVYRTAAPENIGPDRLASADERASDGMEPLLVLVMEGGRRRDAASESVFPAHARLDADLGRLPASAVRLTRPLPVSAEISAALQSLATRVRSGVR
jgi:nicotinate phosphoribosyltransferase